MAEIIINEVSQNYSYNIGSNSFATVALPITACWGPGFEVDVPSEITEDKFEALKWNHFPATQAGLEAFVAMYRGAAAIYRTAKDYSYQMAMSLLSAGYDVLVCRMAPGAKAQGVLTIDGVTFSVTAKYTGTFGNNLKVTIAKNPLTVGSDNYYYNVIVYVEDISGIQTALENLSFVTNELWSTDAIPYIDELESNFIELVEGGATTGEAIVKLAGGTDYRDDTASALVDSINWYNDRYSKAHPSDVTATRPSATFIFEDNGGEYGDSDYEYNGIRITSKVPGNVLRLSLTIYREVSPTSTDNNTPVITIAVGANGGITVIRCYIPTSSDNAGVVYSYSQVQVQMPWSPNKFYTKDDQTGVYTLIATEPQSWSAIGKYTRANAYVPINEVDNPAISVEFADGGKSYAGGIVTTNSYLLETAGAIVRGNTVLEEGEQVTNPDYVISEYGRKLYSLDPNEITAILPYKQTLYSLAYRAYDVLKDKLTYNPQRYISPGWDDQDLAELGGDTTQFTNVPIISALHIKLMDVGYYGRCGTAYIDIPKALPRRLVYNESNEGTPGYAQKLARFKPANASGGDVNGPLYTSHSALFAPWGQYTYVGTTKQATASPSFITLLIQRAMILNQSLQYEWALPTNRRHNLRLGKFDYNIPAHLLKSWQKLSGVGVNCLTSLPDLGNTLWGNSTLFEVPPAVYQALANLSTRFLVNAVEDIAYRCGIAITFQYNNGQAYDKFYAGVTPLLDTMKNVGAISDYYVRMSADINGMDQVNANTVIGKVYLVVNGVINDIIIDLVALPPQTDLSQFAQ